MVWLCRKQFVERLQVALLHEVGKRFLMGLQAAEEKAHAWGWQAGSWCPYFSAFAARRRKGW